MIGFLEASGVDMGFIHNERPRHLWGLCFDDQVNAIVPKRDQHALFTRQIL
jgi:hypothetical protein